MKNAKPQRNVIPYEDVQRRIVCVRQQPVIIDAYVANLYGVETKRVNEAVRNNPDKFPKDYMFELMVVCGQGGSNLVCWMDVLLTFVSEMRYNIRI